MGLTHVAGMIFGTPLLVEPRKLEVILWALGPRLGLDEAFRARLVPGAEDPAAAPKERRPLSVDGGIACVQVMGTLSHRVSDMEAASGLSSYETIADELAAAVADPRVEGILLEVDSFGGGAAGCFDLAEKIRAAREVKPVVGVANQFAMSAGYALLSQCTEVVVPQGGEVGSIGVVTTHMDVTKAAEDAGVKVTHVYAGAHKVDFSPYVSLSDEARARLAADVTSLYGAFVQAVAAGRGPRMSAEKARATEARTFMGAAAVEAGLADRVGDRAAAIERLQALVEQERMDKAAFAAMQTELAAAKTRIATLEAEGLDLKAKVAAYAAADAERQKAEDLAFVEQIAKASAEAQAPIAAEDLALVRQRLEAGDRDGAKALGNAFLRVAKASAGAKTSALRAPMAPQATTHQELVERGKALLAAAADAASKK